MKQKKERKENRVHIVKYITSNSCSNLKNYFHFSHRNRRVIKTICVSCAHIRLNRRASIIHFITFTHNITFRFGFVSLFVCLFVFFLRWLLLLFSSSLLPLLFFLHGEFQSVWSYVCVNDMWTLFVNDVDVDGWWRWLSQHQSLSILVAFEHLLKLLDELWSFKF